MPNIKVRATSIQANVEVVHRSLAGAVVEGVTDFVNCLGERVVTIELQTMPRAVSHDELAAVIGRLERVGAEVVASEVGIRSTTIAATSPAIERVDVNEARETAATSLDVVCLEQEVAGELILNAEIKLLNVRRLKVLIHVTW